METARRHPTRARSRPGALHVPPQLRNAMRNHPPGPSVPAERSPGCVGKGTVRTRARRLRCRCNRRTDSRTWAEDSATSETNRSPKRRLGRRSERRRRPGSGAPSTGSGTRAKDSFHDLLHVSGRYAASSGLANAVLLDAAEPRGPVDDLHLIERLAQEGASVPVCKPLHEAVEASSILGRDCETDAVGSLRHPVLLAVVNASQPEIAEPERRVNRANRSFSAPTSPGGPPAPGRG